MLDIVLVILMVQTDTFAQHQLLQACLIWFYVRYQHIFHTFDLYQLFWSNFADQRLISLRCRTESFRRSFVPTAIRLFNSDCWLWCFSQIYLFMYSFVVIVQIYDHCKYIYIFFKNKKFWATWLILNFPHWEMNKVFFYSILFYSIFFF